VLLKHFVLRLILVTDRYPIDILHHFELHVQSILTPLI
jgi:hypothetical protein